VSHTAPETEGSRIVHDTRGDVRWAWGFAAVFATLPFAFLHFFPLDGAIDPRAPDFNPLVIVPAFLALFAAANVVKATWASKKKSGTVSWNVSVHAAEPGLDFLVEFPVRVEATAPLGYRGREEDEEESRPGALRVP
jgi:hypothetical protein